MEKKNRFDWRKELIAWAIVMAASILLSAIISIFFKYNFFAALRAILGLIYVLFLPGYVVVKLFFSEVDWIEKAALSFGLSIALVILSVMLSNMLFKIPITALTNFFVILAVMIITALIKVYQKQILKFLNKLAFWKKKK
jgi:uncharacterized membrane protein